MCFSVIFTPNWVLATGCKIKAPGSDFVWIVNENVPKLGPQWQGAEIPKTSLFLIGLLLFPVLLLLFPVLLHVAPKWTPGDAIIRVLRSKPATPTCATIGTASTNLACFLLAACLLPSCFLACFLLHCCLLPCCLMPCLLAGLLLACSRLHGGGVGAATVYIYIYIYTRFA